MRWRDETQEAALVYRSSNPFCLPIDSGRPGNNVSVSSRFLYCLGELYAGLDEPRPKVSVKKAREQTDICRHNDKAVQRILTTGFLQKKIFPCLIELAPGGKTTLEQPKPDVEKFCYVISGRVRCSIGH